MDLKTLAGEYRVSGEACRSRAAMLERDLRRRQKLGEITALETTRLRRRISMLRGMAGDCAGTAAYLENYYRGGPGFELYI